ncbi:aminotransferase class I/II-fold pyridoxal phosphate-dependent enzyme [Thomasclavelia cocleata]|uniref:aminotransferase class I/II-fold pyridoxal phosphate-dependent enzyme n=1 Tax=Thomasclavelia cocleata TaxID=69824 RepID=UPI00241EDB7B|nr:aminotransferase class I/II-fold pyridoxal phosphate-dependent enzyme [Thomasclavelia cocleata]
MKIDLFDVEAWMTEHEVDYRYNLAETCVASMSINDLLEMVEEKETVIKNLFDTKLNYGPITGSVRLRKGIAKLYQTGDADNITISHGCINANELVLISLLEKGDHIITITPTYQQMYSFPESFGVETSLVELDEENDWLPKLEDFEKEIKENTRMICLVNPNNPTSTKFSKDFLLKLIAIAKKHNLYILCDEVYQGLGQDEVSVSDLYDLGISTSSLSKVTAFAGLRVGWIRADKEIIKIINDRRDYHIISTGYINDYLASIVVENYDKIIKRSRNIINTNRQILIEWLKNESLVDCIVPEAGTIAFLRYKLPIKSRDLCVELQKDTGVFFVPGACFNQEYHLRFGFANKSEDIKSGLELFSKWLHNKVQ